MRTYKLRERALKVWADNLKRGNIVATKDNIPDRAVRELLKREKLLSPVISGYFILKKPEDEPEQLFLLLYWQIIERFLDRYKPWSIRADSALEILVGNEQDQKHLLIRSAKPINRTFVLPFGFKVLVVEDKDFDSRLTKVVSVVGRKLSVDMPERVLVDAISRKLEVPSAYKSFIRGTKFNVRIIEALYLKRPQPIVLNRVVNIAEESGRGDLASALEVIIRTNTLYRTSRKKKTKEPTASVKEPELIAPWISQQAEHIHAFEKHLEATLHGEIQELPTRNLNELVETAVEHKRYDIYHSTTLEGYQITPEDVDAVIFGKVPFKVKDGDKHVKEIENRMAILGYAEAFDFIIGKVKNDFGRARVSQELVQDTHYQLFKPSADNGIVKPVDLVAYRNAPAFIRGTRYVPPAQTKLLDLMESYEKYVDSIENEVIKAILAHYFFVAIHPYADGNGRTARLLMNYVLLTSGYEWITIRAEQRERYFKALNEGHLSNDILPFGKFILSLMKEASSSS